MVPFLEIDGAYGEGGGQVLRTALTLSALTGRPIQISRIRAGRRNPGLAPQHLTNVLAIARICDAEVEGATLGSTEIRFRPLSRPRPGTYVFDVTNAAQGGSAGSVTLILQTLLLPLAFAATTSQLTLSGGTHVPWSPPFEHIAHIYLPTVDRMGIRATCRLEAWGFYPVGGGKIVVDIHGVNSSGSDTEPGEHPGEPGVTVATRILTPLVLTERGDFRRVWGIAVACNLPAHVAQRMANRAHKMLSSAGLRAEITPRRERGVGSGAGLCLIAEYEYALAGFSALGERGKSSEQVAEETCRDLLAHHASGAPVDSHLSDQLLLPMAFAHGRSELRVGCITRHLLTNAYVIRQLIPVQIEIEGDEGGPGIVVVHGCDPA